MSDKQSIPNEPDRKRFVALKDYLPQYLWEEKTGQGGETLISYKVVPDKEFNYRTLHSLQCPGCSSNSANKYDHYCSQLQQIYLSIPESEISPLIKDIVVKTGDKVIFDSTAAPVLN